MYLVIVHASEYIEEKGVNKYLVFDFIDENKELIKKTINVKLKKQAMMSVIMKKTI